MAKSAYRWTLKQGRGGYAVYVSSVRDGLFFYAPSQRYAHRFRTKSMALAALERRDREVAERGIETIPGSIRVVRLKLKEKTR